jgi:hypothetical protein
MAQIDTKLLLNNLAQVANRAVAQKLVEKENAQKQKQQQEFENIRNAAKEIIATHVTEDKMVAIAEKGIYIYPLLYLGDRCPAKNRKTGYKFNMGKLGEYVYEELVNNNFEPRVLHLHLDSQLADFSNKIVQKTGYYLGISWK